MAWGSTARLLCQMMLHTKPSRAVGLAAPQLFLRAAAVKYH